MQKVRIIGEIRDSFEFFKKSHNETLYTSKIYSNRNSGTCDVLKVVVPEIIKQEINCELANLESITVELLGEFRSRNIHIGDVSKVALYLYASSIRVVDNNTPHDNRIEFDGFIVKKYAWRTTPKGRQIADICIAINRPTNNASDYIPTIAWGNYSLLADKLDIGTHIKGIGRIQSREYVKKYSDGKQETKTAYEMSLSSFCLDMGEDTDNDSEVDYGTNKNC